MVERGENDICLIYSTWTSTFHLHVWNKTCWMSIMYQMNVRSNSPHSHWFKLRSKSLATKLMSKSQMLTPVRYLLFTNWTCHFRSLHTVKENKFHSYTGTNVYNSAQIKTFQVQGMATVIIPVVSLIVDYVYVHTRILNFKDKGCLPNLNVRETRNRVFFRGQCPQNVYYKKNRVYYKNLAITIFVP